MPPKGFINRSLREKSLSKLEDWLEEERKKGNTSDSSADVIDRLITFFMIEVTGDTELKRIAEAYSKAATKTHKSMRETD